MNMLQSVGLVVTVLGAAATCGAQEFRTDINPALRYYQAFLEKPNLPQADHDYLFVREWRGEHLEPRFGELIGKYDYQFRFLREAAGAEVPCDWGIDLTGGPDALLPALAQAKAAAQAARLRTMWHLQNGRQGEARDDLLAAFTLGRNVSRDGVLVSALVQMAMENIVQSIVAETFSQWEPEKLRQLVDGFDAAPARGTIAQCIPAEEHSFHDWLLRKVHQLQLENEGNEAKTLERLGEVLARLAGEAEADRDLTARLIKAGGGSLEGVLNLIRELKPLYAQVTALMALSHGPFEEQMGRFMAAVAEHPNPLVPKLFTVFDKCRTKEFGVMVNFAMVRAAVEYKLRGEAGLKSVADPCGKGPFAIRRFMFEGEDRGFELRSPYNGRGFDEVMIFLEKGSLPIHLMGKNAGKRLPGAK
jgi:hypothetical protein